MQEDIIIWDSNSSFDQKVLVSNWQIIVGDIGGCKSEGELPLPGIPAYSKE